MRRHVTISTLSLILPVALWAAAAQKDLLVALKFVPQESVSRSSVALPGSILDSPVEIRLEDSRAQADPKVIGNGTDDDDRPFPIVSSVDVPKYASEAVAQIAGEYGLKRATTADRKLLLRLTRFIVNENNKAVGSTYAAEVHLAYSISDGAGKMLYESAAAGGASRYGRARSGDNCSEVLSDALKDAFLRVVGDKALQDAWKSGTAATDGLTMMKGKTPAPKESVEERLRKLKDLFDQGLITEEEYKTKRAEILKDADR